MSKTSDTELFLSQCNRNSGDLVVSWTLFIRREGVDDVVDDVVDFEYFLQGLTYLTIP